LNIKQEGICWKNEFQRSKANQSFSQKDLAVNRFPTEIGKRGIKQNDEAL